MIINNHWLLTVRIGNYMQMMSVLEPIAYDALEFLTHLFDYYLFAVSYITVISLVIYSVSMVTGTFLLRQ